MTKEQDNKLSERLKEYTETFKDYPASLDFEMGKIAGFVKGVKDVVNNPDEYNFMPIPTEEGINQFIKSKKDDPAFNDELISDGWHTFGELYEFRKMYNAAYFNLLTKNGLCSVHKSWKHNDGEYCFGSERKWFIVSAMLPTGLVSNHYKAKDWDLFDVPEVEKALFEFDGHTGEDVLVRLNVNTNSYEINEWPTDEEIDGWFGDGQEVHDRFWEEAPYRTNGDRVEEIKEAFEYFKNRADEKAQDNNSGE